MSAEDETPEQPPPPSARSLRVMAFVRWGLLLLVTLLAVTTVWKFWGPNSGEAHTTPREAQYTCSMHPQIRSPGPGKCPICGMDLVPISSERQGGGPAPMANTTAAGAATLPNVIPVTLSAEQQQSVGVATALVESTTLGNRLRVPGVVSAPETGLSQVRVRAPGFIERVSVGQTGVRVRSGDPLAYVYSPEIFRAQEEFLAASRWGGTSGDAGSDVGGPSLLSAARRGLDLLGLSDSDIDAISRSGQPIRAIPVRAPADGYVTRFNAVLGSRAEPDTVLYEIADLSKVWVIASVNERDLGTVREGTTARFTASTAQGEVLTGKIELIEPILDEATRTFRVRLVLPNRGGALRPGQFGDVDFELPSVSTLVVPRDAVIHTGEHQYVYVATSGDRFEPRLVTTGLTREGRVQVLSGLSEGERVVTRGTFMLDSESRLRASLAADPSLEVGRDR